jgi:trigger factor
MQIIEEKIDDLNLVLNIEIKNEDYHDKYKSSLKSYAKQVNIPGFRSGKVPDGLIRKKYGKALLAEELNKIVNDSLNDYIKTHNLKVLGSPLPTASDTDNGNWDQPEDFSFKYDIGLSPEFDLKLNKKTKHDYLLIEVADKMVNDHIENLRKRYGKVSTPDVAGDNDMIIGDLVELDDNDEIVEGGIMNESTISLEFLDDKKTKKSLIGSKPGDHVIVDPHKISKNEDDLAKMLGIDKSNISEIKNNFRFNVKDVKAMEPAELNDEFFAKMGAEGEIKSFDDLKAKITKDTELQFANESDKLFINKMSTYLLDNTDIALPDDFLKRFIKLTNEKPITDEQLEKDYDAYANSLKWQLIESKLIEQGGIKIGQEEVLANAKQFVANQYAQYGLPAPDDENLTALANQNLKNEDEARKIFDRILEDRLISYLKETVKLNEKTVSLEDFYKAAQSF